MLGEYDLNPAGGAARPGARLTSMMAPSIVLAPRAARGSSSGSAGSVRLRGAIMQAVVNVVDHGLGVRGGDRRAARPRRGAAPPLRGRASTRPSSTRSRRAATTSSAGAGATSTSAASPRSRSAGRQRSPRPAIRAAAGTGSSSGDARRQPCVRPARPGDAAALVALAEAVGARAGGLADLRRAAGAASATSAATCSAVRRHPDAAVFVAERDGRDRRPPLALARPASREPARRRPGADGRVRQRRTQGVGTRAARAGGRLGARDRRPQARAPRLPAQRARDRAVRAFGFVREGYRQAHYRARRRDTSTRS